MKEVRRHECYRSRLAGANERGTYGLFGVCDVGEPKAHEKDPCDVGVAKATKDKISYRNLNTIYLD